MESNREGGIGVYVCGVRVCVYVWCVYVWYVYICGMCIV